MAGIHGINPGLLAEVDPPFSALRVSVWPQDCLGEYRIGQSTGLLTGVAANGEIFQFRWTDANNLCVIKFIKVRYAVITSFTAAQELAFDVIPSVNWSASGSGGTAIVPSATNLMKRSSYSISKVGDLRIATTAALGAGTKTAFGNTMAASAAKTLAGAATVQDIAFEEAVDMTNSGDAPLVLLQNEGFSVRNAVAMGAGGTVRATIQVAWAEFANAAYPSL